MQTLTENWFSEGRIDFEYKKYLLLAYLQRVSKEFAAYRLYPPLADLISHHKNLVTYQQQKDQMSSAFPKELDQESFRQLKLAFHGRTTQREEMEELDLIIDFSIPLIHANLREGIERFEEIDHSIQINPVGIVPLYNKEGYFFLSQEPDPRILIYQYRVLFLDDPTGRFQGISAIPIGEEQKSIAHTPEHIKRHLTRPRQILPNPAVYLIQSDLKYPAEEAVLPVVKRKFLSMISAA